MPENLSAPSVIIYASFIAGVLCSLALRGMRAGSARGWTKLAAFLFIAASAVFQGITDFQHQHQRTITPIKVAGTLINLHEVPGGPRSSPIQHFNVDAGVGGAMPDLHIEDPLFFMKGQNGEQVEVTFTKESGYVSSLRIVSGHDTGYQFEGPDARNGMPGLFFIVVGVVLGIVGIFKWIVDHNADPALAG